MNIKPAHDILVLEKTLKIIQFSIENYCNSDDLRNAWTMIFCLTDDSFTLSERFSQVFVSILKKIIEINV